MSSVTKNLPEIRRHPEAMYVRFADLPYEVSLEVADNFIVDFSPDYDIVGLEILWEDTDRADSEPALLAFGMFASAVVWRAYHHKEHNGPKMRWAILRKVKEFVSASGLPLQVSTVGQTTLTINSEGGKTLLCADLQYYPKRVLTHEDTQKPKSPPMPVGEIRSAIDNLSDVTLPNNPDAVGVALFVDAFSAVPYGESVSPGKWVTWPEAAKHVRTHIAVIPPDGRTYPWLPDSFISTQT